jgi:hypothetical protein
MFVLSARGAPRSHALETADLTLEGASRALTVLLDRAPLAMRQRQQASWSVVPFDWRRDRAGGRATWLCSVADVRSVPPDQTTAGNPTHRSLSHASSSTRADGHRA